MTAPGSPGVDKPAEDNDDLLDKFDARYPARRVLDLIGDKWTPIVLYCLSVREVRRFNELHHQIPGLSKKMLTQTLRKLERDGLLVRTVYAQSPPKTEYQLTEDGHKLREPIAQLCAWAIENDAFIAAILSRRNLP
ncbi:MAG: helix-turn-helix domain-containing protein [Pseudomonadota bacterium]